jgi:hypothetical protein
MGFSILSIYIVCESEPGFFIENYNKGQPVFHLNWFKNSCKWVRKEKGDGETRRMGDWEIGGMGEWVKRRKTFNL